MLGQLPSHRANAVRTMDFLGDAAGADFMDRYRAWEGDYEAYLADVSRDDVPEGEGATLLDMVDEKERLLRARGLDDLFAGMKAEENAIATALFPVIAAEMDDIWEPNPGAWYGPGEHPDPTAKGRMIRAVIECCLAGNLFDAGSAAAVQGVTGNGADEPDAREQTAEQRKRYRLDAAQLAETFAKAREKVSYDAAGGWRFDSLDAIVARADAGGWRRVIIFCDNAGADTMGMVLLAKALAALGGKGTKIALAANTTAGHAHALHDTDTDTDTDRSPHLTLNSDLLESIGRGLVLKRDDRKQAFASKRSHVLCLNNRLEPLSRGGA